MEALVSNLTITLPLPPFFVSADSKGLKILCKSIRMQYLWVAFVSVHFKGLSG